MRFEFNRLGSEEFLRMKLNESEHRAIVRPGADAGIPGLSCPRRAKFSPTVTVLLPLAGCSSSQNNNQPPLPTSDQTAPWNWNRCKQRLSAVGERQRLSGRPLSGESLCSGWPGNCWDSGIDNQCQRRSIWPWQSGGLPGTYAPVRYGIVVGNESRVVFGLRTKRRDHALHCQADCVGVEPGWGRRRNLDAMIT
jgi:hypothetical protein